MTCFHGVCKHLSHGIQHLHSPKPPQPSPFVFRGYYKIMFSRCHIPSPLFRQSRYHRAHEVVDVYVVQFRRQQPLSRVLAHPTHPTQPHPTPPHPTPPHHTLSTPQLYPWAGCRVRSPAPRGGHHPMGGVLTVSGVRTPQCQTPPPGSPRPPSTGR